jgi:hypothetical protein
MARAFVVQTAGLALVVLTGVGHGRLTNRWDAPDLEGPAERLARLPWVIGEWEGRPVQLDPAVARLEPSESRGEIRNYVHRATGATVLVHLACGLRNPTLVHSPDWCYTCQGYEAFGESVAHTLAYLGGEGPAEVRVATYGKVAAEVPHRLRLIWAWRGGATWHAPQSPRFVFAPYPRLYKLALVRQLGAPDESLAADPALDLLGALLPEVEKVVTP